MAIGHSIASLNWAAVIAAAVAASLFGATWYSHRFFGAVWMREIGLTEEAVRKSNAVRIFGGAFVLQLVGATAMALFLAPHSDWRTGLQYGLLIGVCWIATTYGITYFFEQRMLRLYLINTGHYVLMFAGMGTIIGALS